MKSIVKYFTRVEFQNYPQDKGNKQTGIYALFYLIYIAMVIYLFGLLKYRTDYIDRFSVNFSNELIFKVVIYICISILELSPLLFLLKTRRERVQTIGLISSNITSSIVLGIIGGLPFTYWLIRDLILHKRNLQLEGANLWLEFLVIFMFTALTEELIFRGYIQSRVIGLISNKYAAILLIGILFAFMHIPFQMSMVNMNFMEYLITNRMYMIQLFYMHIYFVYLYTRNHNILTPIISHAIIDYFQIYM